MMSVKHKDKLFEELKDLELKIYGLKALMFENFQPFNDVYEKFVVGEMVEVSDIGYAIVTDKNQQRIKFKTILKNGKEWLPHWQDVDKKLKIKKGIYYDILSQKEHKENSEIFIPAMKPSHFKSVGKDDLIIHGEIYKK